MELKLLKKKDKPFLVLDVGTEAVKSLIVEKDSEVRILGSGISYLEDEISFNKAILAEEFETEKIKRAVKESIKSASVSSLPFLKRNERLEKLEAILSLDPTKVRAQVIEEVSVREDKKQKIKKKEKEVILDYILKSAREDTFKIGLNKLGLLPEDIEILSLKILDREIEGYSVSDILGCQGKDLTFKILVIFGSRIYLEKIREILNDLDFKIIKIVHLSQVIESVFSERAKDGFFFDVGGEATQIISLNNSILTGVELFERGGSYFTEAIFEELNLNERDARIFKEKYSNKSLEPEISSKLKEMFSNEKDVWRKNFKKYQKSPSFLLGGSAFFPEIKDVFKNKKIIKINDLEKARDLSEKIKDSQFIPAILTSLI